MSWTNGAGAGDGTRVARKGSRLAIGGSSDDVRDNLGGA